MVIPAYAEVKSLKTDKPVYKKGETITFTGTLGVDDSGIVYVVVNDPADAKAAFKGTFADIDHNFKVDIDTGSSKNSFVTTGIYSATAFIDKVEDGIKINFDFSLDG